MGCLKEQISGLWELVRHPIESAKNIYNLAKGFVLDPGGTIELIVEELGEDLRKLLKGTAFERGQVIGEKYQSGGSGSYCGKSIEAGQGSELKDRGRLQQLYGGYQGAYS